MLCKYFLLQSVAYLLIFFRDILKSRLFYYDEIQVIIFFPFLICAFFVLS